jgi:hypothetical protein
MIHEIDGRGDLTIPPKQDREAFSKPSDIDSSTATTSTLDPAIRRRTFAEQSGRCFKDSLA